MKNLNKLLFLILLALAGCTRSDEELLFNETPVERMSKLQQELKQQLVDAKYGWKVMGTTLLKGNFGHYMDFDAGGNKDRVRMVSDINDVSSAVVRSSAYRVKLVNAPVLSFESYTYIHMLADPNPDVIGGALGDGFKGDIEFELQRTTADSLILIGRKHRTKLVMIKATQEEQQKYLNGGYLETINDVKDIFANNQVSLFDYKGVTYQMTINAFGRSIGVMSVINNEIKTASDIFSYTIDGLQIDKGIPLNNGSISKILLSEDKLYVLTDKGERLEVRASQTPLLPLNKLMGYTYSKLHLPFRVDFPGTNTEGAKNLNQLSGFIAIPAVPGGADKTELNLVWDVPNQRIMLEGLVFYGASPTPTRYRYDYTFNATTGLYKLSNKVVLNTGYAVSRMTLMDTFLLNNEFTLDYYFVNGNAYGRIVNKTGTVTMTMLPN